MNADPTPSILTALIRAALTTGGGYLASHGFVTSDQASQIVGGAAVVAGVAWSIWQKVVAGRKLKVAIAAPAMAVK